MVAQAVDFRLPGRVRAQHVKDGAGLVDGIAAHPGARGVRPLARHGNLGAQRALAPAFDLAGAGLHQHGEVPGQQFRAVAAQPQQPVTVGRDLLAVIEDVRDVPAGRGQAGGEPELHGQPRFHVRGPAAVQTGTLKTSGRLPATGTVSTWPARITRSARPSVVRATIELPSRCTVRCGSDLRRPRWRR